MARLTQDCPKCGKVLEQVNSIKLASTQELVSYKCGHAFVNEITATIAESNGLHFNALDDSGHEAWEFQQKGVQFILENDFNALIADQMRLGKTPQALLALRNKYSERKKVLILVKSANMVQWMREYKKWTDPMPLGIFPIFGSKSFIPPGFHTYIMSHDLLAKPGTCKTCKHQMHQPGDCGRCKKGGCLHPVSNDDSMAGKLLKMGFDLVIVDEFHNFKNSSSQRAQVFNAFLKTINIQEVTKVYPMTCTMCGEKWETKIQVKIDGGEAEKSASKISHCPKCFCQVFVSGKVQISTKRLCPCLTLTGTPIENIADEYFPILNIEAPTIFPSRESFRRNWLEQDSAGKWSRIKRRKVQDFRNLVSKFVLRREWEDVYRERPQFNKSFTVIKLEDQELKELYNRQLDKIEAMAISGQPLNYFNTIGELTVLRQICGLAKTKWTADQIAESMAEKPHKHAIGFNFHGVKDQLKLYLQEHGVITLDGTDSPQRKDEVMRVFEKDQNNVLLISLIAGGEGMDFAYVPQVTVLEREWRSTREQQFEARFYNPNKELMASRGYPDKVTDVEYVICEGTIDEWFHEMLRKKATMFGETVSNNWDIEKDPGSFKELLEQTLAGRL